MAVRTQDADVYKITVSASPPPTQVVDQLGRCIELSRAPQRVVSLCPSTTETLFALGAGARIVGRTDYCCHPADQVEAIASVGGTKRVRLERVAELGPDLVVSVREENDRGQVEALAERWPVLVLDPVDVSSAIAGIPILGDALGAGAGAGARPRARPRARTLACDIETAFGSLPSAGGARVVYLIWRKPFMAAGRGTYLDDVLTRLGCQNPVRKLDARYPELDPDWVRSAAPDFLLASSEPFPFADKHLDELRALAPSATPLLVDGELFSWHGARMLQAARYFADLVPRLATRRP